MKNKAIKLMVTLGSLFSLVACLRAPKNTSSQLDDSSAINISGVKELRNPEDLTHPFAYNYSLNADYLLFESKMKSFSSKLSEIIAKREYESGENYVFSPLSVELCLGLAIRSSSGATRQELLEINPNCIKSL